MYNQYKLVLKYVVFCKTTGQGVSPRNHHHETGLVQREVYLGKGRRPEKGVEKEKEVGQRRIERGRDLGEDWVGAGERNGK